MGILEPGNMFILDGTSRPGGVDRITMVRNGRQVGVLETGDTFILLSTMVTEERRRVRYNMPLWQILAKGQVATIFVNQDERDSLRLLSQS